MPSPKHPHATSARTVRRGARQDTRPGAWLRVAPPPKRDSCALVSNPRASEQLGRLIVACGGNTESRVTLVSVGSGQRFVASSSRFCALRRFERFAAGCARFWRYQHFRKLGQEVAEEPPLE